MPLGLDWETDGPWVSPTTGTFTPTVLPSGAGQSHGLDTCSRGQRFPLESGAGHGRDEWVFLSWDFVCFSVSWVPPGNVVVRSRRSIKPPVIEMVTRTQLSAWDRHRGGHRDP